MLRRVTSWNASSHQESEMKASSLQSSLIECIFYRFVNVKIRKVNEGQIEDNNDKLDTKSRPCSSVSRTTPSCRSHPNRTTQQYYIAYLVVLISFFKQQATSSSCRCRSRTRTKTWRGWMSLLRSEVSSVMERGLWLCFG